MRRMIRLMCLVFSVSFLVPRADPTDHPPYGEKLTDPRFVWSPVIRYHNREPSGENSLANALLIHARLHIGADQDAVNRILGVEGAFTDEQIIAGLTKFYQEWKPDPAQYERDIDPPPSLIVAVETWGAGRKLWESIELISKKHHIDVYEIYPAMKEFVPSHRHPTRHDKRLAELIKDSSAGKP